MRPSTSFLVPLLTLLPATLLASCSSGDDGAATGATGTPVEDLSAELAGAVCDTLESCLGPGVEVFLGTPDCAASLKTTLDNGELALLERAVEDGRVRYDGTRVPACLDALRAEGCGALARRLDVLCEGVVEGSLESGEPCSLDIECAPGLFCQAGSTCPGTCTARLGAGQPCTDSDECRDGLVCSEETERCVAPAAEGASCGGASPECAPGLICRSDEGGAGGTCVAVDAVFSGAAGAQCDLMEARFCDVGLSCGIVDVTESAEPELVMECLEPVASGAACRLAVPAQCPRGEYCEVPENQLEGACLPLPTEEQPCAETATSEEPVCAAEHACVNGTCRALRQLGAACTADAMCHSEHCVDGGCAPSVCAD